MAGSVPEGCIRNGLVSKRHVVGDGLPDTGFHGWEIHKEAGCHRNQSLGWPRVEPAVISAALYSDMA